MAKPLEEAPRAGPAAQVRDFAPRRTRAVIRKVRPWSVLKFSLLFYFCLMLVVWLALMMLYGIMGALGVTDQVSKLLVEFSLVDPGFAFDGVWIFTRLFFLGLGMVVLWSLINLFVVFLYNLCADVVGGIEVTLSERR